jgi:hypothetical protein
MDLQKINDSLDSLHHRMDRFYAWASQLQVEFRDLKQRIGFLEATVQSNFYFNDKDTVVCAEEEELMARLKAMK